jgi:hypothetical protein
MKKGSARRVAASSSVSIAGADSAVSPSGRARPSREEAVSSTAEVLGKLGEAVIDVKAAFDAAARPGAHGTEAVVQVTDRSLGSALRALGLEFGDGLLERLVAEGILDAGVGATATFSVFLRVIGRLMQLFRLTSLDGVLPAPAPGEPSAPQIAASEAGSAAASNGSVAQKPAVSASATVHDQGRSGPLFRAGIGHRLALPPVPVPTELLRSIFERFASARMVAAAPMSLPGQAPGDKASSPPLSPSRQRVVRGIAFSAWTASLAAAGVPVAPSEARELFRFLHLSLGELVTLTQLREAYLAIAGFRFLVMSGLLREGADMLAVVASGRHVLQQVVLSSAEVDSAAGESDSDVSDLSDDVDVMHGETRRSIVELGDPPAGRNEEEGKR